MSRANPLRDAGLAFSLMTVVPTHATLPDDGSVPQAAGWFPMIGLALGAVGYGLVKAMETLPLRHSQPLLLATIVVAVWALLTRFLHFDGLADVADGFWGSHDPARRLEIMSDSHTGAFGATALVLATLLEVAALAAVLAAPRELPLLLVPALSRFSATAGCWLGTPARAGGLGRSVMARPTVIGALPAVAVLAVVAVGLWLGFGVAGAVLFAFGLVVALGVPHALAGRFGGVTGDVLGASVLLTEAIVFVAIALVG